MVKSPSKSIFKYSEEDLAKMPAEMVYELGSCYFLGSQIKEHKVPVDQKYAVELWLKARDKGSPHAAYSLATLKLEETTTVLLKDDTSDPISVLQGLADAGFTQAIANLARYHMFGNYGLKKDYNKAIALYERAAKKGDNQAPYNLYLLYNESGEPEHALKWLRQASDHGDTNAKFFLANWYNFGGPFIEQDKERACRLYKDAADAGHAVAAHNFACASLTGSGCEQSASSALYYFRLSSDAGYLPAKMNLAQIYVEGLVVPQDVETAKILYREVLADTSKTFESIREQAKTILLQLELNPNTIKKIS